MVYPVADRLAALDVPFLFATGDVQGRDNPRYGAQPRLEKPVIAPELLRALDDLFAAMPHGAPRIPDAGSAQVRAGG